MHDPFMFPAPDEFRPERFLETTNPRLQDFDLPFGFGRRICVGMHLAKNSLFISIAQILWAFDILPIAGADGRLMLPDPWEFTNGFNSKPASFQCAVKPRSMKGVECVEREWEAGRELLGKWQ